MSLFPCLKGKTPRVETGSPVKIKEPPIDVMDTGPRRIIKIALVVGHNKKDQGANNYLGESEWQFNSRIARKIQVKLNDLGIDSVIIFRPYNVSYSRQCNSVADQVKEHKCTHAILLHFNDASGTSAMGCEVLVKKTSTLEDDKFADTFTDILNERYGFKERRNDGMYVVSSRHNGYGMINAIDAITCLVEACFAGYKNKESELVFEHEDKYVDVFIDSITLTWSKM